MKTFSLPGLIFGALCVTDLVIAQKNLACSPVRSLMHMIIKVELYNGNDAT